MEVHGLEETFEPVAASNQKMSEDIIKDLALITEGLNEIKIYIEVKKELSRPKMGSKRCWSSRGSIYPKIYG